LRVQTKKWSQKDLAAQLRVDQSRISRIESGEAPPTPAEIKAFLETLESLAASSYLAYLQKDWRILERPPLSNPDIEAIWRAEQKLQRLEVFERDRNPPAPVRAELAMHRESLEQAGTYLTRTDHELAFLGQAGVGKTTSLGVVAGLVQENPTLSLDKRLLLETGKGRITLCEVRIVSGDEWGIRIEPTPEPEIYRLVGELCAGACGDTRSPATIEEKGVPRELDRALRNMAGLPRSVKKLDGKSVINDPLIDLQRNFKTPEELASEFASRLKLWKRTKKEVWCPKGERDTQQWLRDTFARVNKGQCEDMSLPTRIDVVVPHGLLNQDTFVLTLIDTRGIDETSVRPDLRARIDNPRTLSILCSEFKAAPDASIKQLLQHLMDTGADRAIADRVALLVLPQHGDARGVTDDSGQPVENDSDGYEIKRDQVINALKLFGATGIRVLMFNSLSDSPEDFAAELIALIKRLRERQIERIDTLSKAVDQLIRNYEERAAQLVRASVNKELHSFLSNHESLPQARQQAHDFLLGQLDRAHARTVWATTRRQGGWYNLDVYYCLGAGTASETRRRSERFFLGIDAVVTTMLANEDLAAAHPFLNEVLLNIQAWKETFLETVQRSGAENFRPALQAETQLWAAAESRWGQGLGYRDDVVNLFRSWFLDPQHEGLHKALEKRVKASWREEVIDRMRAICTDEVQAATKKHA